MATTTRSKQGTAERATASADRLALRIPEAARACGCGTRTIWRLISTHRLRVARIGRRVVVPVDALRDFIAEGGAAR